MYQSLEAERFVSRTIKHVKKFAKRTLNVTLLSSFTFAAQLHSSSFQMDTLCFRLPGHGDTTLKHMDSLRSRQQFCDITIVASNNQSFKGHKVVLAACSPYLRDQFLLNPSSKLQVFPHGLRLDCNCCRHPCFMPLAFSGIFPRCR